MFHQFFAIEVVSLRDNGSTAELGDSSTGCVHSQAATGGSEFNVCALCPVCHHSVEVTDSGVFCIHSLLGN